MTSIAARKAHLPAAGTLATICLAGLAGAAIDAIYFSASARRRGGSPDRVLQSIAAFWFGPSARELGATTATVGAATHVALATMMAAGFVLLDSRVHWRMGSTVARGVAYGLFLYLLMYLVVLPLRWPNLYPRWDSWRSLLDIAVHCAIGVAFAFIVEARKSAPRSA